MILRLCATFLALFLSASALAQTTVVTADRMLDVRSGKIVSPATVVVTDGVISAVNPASPPEGAQRVDLGDHTLMPGLLDMHTHITMDFFTGNDWVTAPVMETAADWAIRGVHFADLTLQAGFTTIRDVGTFPGFADVALMRAINRGTVPGPDIWPAGHYISITGGHCDITGFAPGVMEIDYRHGVSDGVDEVMKAVRYQAKHGVKVIKVCATAGVFSFSQNAPVGAQQYSQEELDVIVREASKLGLKVAAHAHGTDGINAAVRAGVASIEHGSVLSDESIKLMKKNGTFLVPNIYINGLALPPDTPPATVAKNEYLKPLVYESLLKAYEGGVKMALGTDSCIYPHGENGKEFGALVDAGIPPVHALRMGTLFAAELLGSGDRGELKEGLRGDIIAVAGNPLDNIRTMEDVKFVMKQGVVYKGDPGSMAR